VSDRAGGTGGPGAGLLDWNQAWQAARARTQRKRGKEAWDRRAPSFTRAVGQSDYAELLLARLPLDPAWDVLDVGCGSGTLAVPLAARVRAVTAVDYSEKMIELLRQRCAERGLAGVRPVLGAWEDDWGPSGLGLGRHDVAIASRSLTVEDLAAALRKLDAAARRAVHVVAPVGTGPIDGRVFEAVGRTFVPGPDYVYCVNLLHQLGVYASVSFLEIADQRRYTGLEDALEGLAWMLPEPTPEELARLRAWVEAQLLPGPDGWRLAAPRAVRWAVVSWTPGTLR
jgi:SAM-dependent methyltransferase